MTSRFARQSFLGKDSERILASTKVGIVGLGGGGSHIVQQLAHVGIGRFAVIDHDRVDLTSLNRLVGATAQDVAQKTPKSQVAARVIGGINSTAAVMPIEGKWQEHAEALRDCAMLFGCVDSFSEREQLERFARRFLIPYIDIGMDVHAIGSQYAISGQVALSFSGSHCLRCLGILTDERIAKEAERYGAAGDRAQVIWPNGLLASAAVGIFVQLVTPWHGIHSRTIYLEYDGNAQTLVPSPRLEYVLNTPCPHFRDSDVGDPFYTPCI